MKTTRTHIAAALMGAVATLGAGAALAQQTSDGSDYRPMQITSVERPEVQQGAVDSARAHNGGGSEVIGSSTAPRSTQGNGGDAAYQAAVASAHAHNGGGSEAIGSSTSLPLPQTHN